MRVRSVSWGEWYDGSGESVVAPPPLVPQRTVPLEYSLSLSAFSSLALPFIPVLCFFSEVCNFIQAIFFLSSSSSSGELFYSSDTRVCCLMRCIVIFSSYLDYHIRGASCMFGWWVHLELLPCSHKWKVKAAAQCSLAFDTPTTFTHITCCLWRLFHSANRYMLPWKSYCFSIQFSANTQKDERELYTHELSGLLRAI